jgi:SAM-dependent methyltransferase
MAQATPRLNPLRLAWARLTSRSPERRFGFRIARPESYPTPLEWMAVRPYPGYVGSAASLDHHRRHWLAPDYHRDLREAFRHFLGDGFTGTVLEVGCGMGHLHHVLGLRREQYTGVDLNERFLAAGREHFPGIRLVQGSADRLPFADGSFDCVLCSDVLIHLEDMRPALREIVRVSRGAVLLRMRSGNGAFQKGKIVYDPYQERLFGRVALDGRYYHGYYNVLAPEDLAVMLCQVGVTSYECIDLLPPGAAEHGLTKVFFRAA